jgi:hypothetical protein
MTYKSCGALGCLLFLLGAYAFVHFKLLCLCVPCDRVLIFKIKVLGPSDPQAAKCVLQLFDKEDVAAKRPLRVADVEGDAAEFIVGAWGGHYDGRVLCRGFKPSSLIPFYDSESKKTIDLGMVHLEPDSPRN